VTPAPSAAPSLPVALEPFAPEPFAPGPAGEARPALPPNARQTRFLSWTLDVLISVVVINLFVEYVPSVIVESFSMSILTAILLKVLMDGIVAVKGRVRGWFGARRGRWRFAGYAALWLVLFTSKYVVLAATDLVFGDRVSLGGFVEVSVLILALIASREAIALVYDRLLGTPQPAADIEVRVAQ
jgi:uncharacterized membrane protein YecN with MAPEG domain